MSKAWGLRLTSNAPALLESTHKPGVNANIYKPMETSTYLTFTLVFIKKMVMCVSILAVIFYIATGQILQPAGITLNLRVLQIKTDSYDS